LDVNSGFLLQVRDRPLKDLVAARTDARNCRCDRNIRDQTYALQLTAIGPPDIMPVK
jgi:hypothetical protein